MKVLNSLLVLTIFCFMSACSKNEETWGETEMYYMAKEKEPDMELVFLQDSPENAPKRIRCPEEFRPGEEEIKAKFAYPGEGCAPGSGKRVKVRMVELILLKYEEKKFACRAAVEIKQWYSRNWLFDNVSGEPVLEDFVQVVFGAKKPLSKKDCD